MNFLGTKQITLRPGAADNLYTFTFDAAATETGSGALPFGSIISSATVVSYDNDDNEVTLVTLSETNDNDIIVSFSYPDGGAGMYYMIIKLTLEDGSVYVNHFDRIRCL